MHVGLRIRPEGKKSLDAGIQEEDPDSGQTASISESTIKAESGRERHYEIRCHVPRHSTRVFLLRITDSEESLPSSVTQQNERNPREPEKVQVSISADLVCLALRNIPAFGFRCENRKKRTLLVLASHLESGFRRRQPR